jgi:hypothetical protein
LRGQDHIETVPTGQDQLPEFRGCARSQNGQAGLYRPVLPGPKTREIPLKKAVLSPFRHAAGFRVLPKINAKNSPNSLKRV